MSEEQTDVRLRHVERFVKIAEMTKAVNLPKDKLRALANLPWTEVKDKLEALAASGGTADGARLLEKLGAPEMVLDIELALESCHERLARIQREMLDFKGGLRREDVDQEFLDKVAAHDHTYATTVDLARAFSDVCGLVRKTMGNEKDETLEHTVEDLLAKLVSIKFPEAPKASWEGKVDLK